MLSIFPTIARLFKFKFGWPRWRDEEEEEEEEEREGYAGFGGAI